MSDAPAYLVAGAAGNLGRALAQVLAEGGARVALADRHAEAAAQVASGLPGAGHVALPVGDVTTDAAAVVEAAIAALGRLDGVAQTVGGFAMAPVADDRALWESMFRLNVMATRDVFAAAAPPMRAAGGGALVAVAAGAALKAGAGMGAYAAAKAGVMRLVEAMAAEGAADGLRVNAVLPGVIDTPQNRAAMPDADPSGWVSPRAVATAAAFLLGPAAIGVTGIGLPVTGRP